MYACRVNNKYTLYIVSYRHGYSQKRDITFNSSCFSCKKSRTTGLLKSIHAGVGRGHAADRVESTCPHISHTDPDRLVGTRAVKLPRVVVKPLLVMVRVRRVGDRVTKIQHVHNLQLTTLHRIRISHQLFKDGRP